MAEPGLRIGPKVIFNIFPFFLDTSVRWSITVAAEGERSGEGPSYGELTLHFLPLAWHSRRNGRRFSASAMVETMKSAGPSSPT